MELVFVVWEDAAGVDSTLGWVARDSAQQASGYMFSHVGFVYDADPWSITLTEAYSDHQMAPRTRIPIGMIRRFVYLDPARGRAEDV